jgi:hypothetical protein
MEQVRDLGGLRELGGGGSPDPCGAVAEDGELADVVRAAADASCLHHVAEHGGLEGGDVAGRVPVPDRVSLLAEIVLGEEHGGLDLAGAGAAFLALAFANGPAAAAVPVIAASPGDKDVPATPGSACRGTRACTPRSGTRRGAR